MELNKSIIKGWQVIEVKGQVDSKTVSDLRDYLDQNIIGDLPSRYGTPFASTLK